MPGGLMQLVNYGAQDIFLTGNPQITFFKLVYRRYTNFSIEALCQDFIGDLNFGKHIQCVIEKVGDLIGQTYIEVELPEVDLIKPVACRDYKADIICQQYQEINILYAYVTEFIKINTKLIRYVLDLLKIHNLSEKELINLLDTNEEVERLEEIRNELQDYICTKIVLPEKFQLKLIYQLDSIDIYWLVKRRIKINDDDSYASTIDSDEESNCPETNNDEQFMQQKMELKNIIEHQLYNELQDFYLSIYNIYHERKKRFTQYETNKYQERYECAWVDSIGQALVELIDFRIGSELIDRQTGEFMMAVFRLFQLKYQTKNTAELIGNVPELITFNDCIKPAYKLYVPLSFWFCRNPGLYLPLVSLRYQDAIIELSLRALEKLFYIGQTNDIKNIGAIQDKYDINLRGIRLWINYIYLDHHERLRFAQSSHEYLIEVVQYNEANDICSSSYLAELIFCHPTKYMFWFVQPNWYRHNPCATNKCRFGNWGTCEDYSGFTIDREYLRMNGYERTDEELCQMFYNYVQPWLYFQHSMTDGFNLYSFGMKPMEHQPSGTCNLSRLNDFTISMEFTKKFIELMARKVIENIVGGYFACYTVAYDVLRIASGMASLAFLSSY